MCVRKAGNTGLGFSGPHLLKIHLRHARFPRHGSAHAALVGVSFCLRTKIVHRQRASPSASPNNYGFSGLLEPSAAYPLFFIDPRYLVPSSLLILILLFIPHGDFLEHHAGIIGKTVDEAWYCVTMLYFTFFFVVRLVFSVTSRGYHRNCCPTHCTGVSRIWGTPVTVRPVNGLDSMLKRGHDVTVLNPGRPDVILFYASGKKGIPGRGVPVDLESTLPDLGSLLESDARAYLVVTREQIQLLDFQCPSQCPLASLWNDPNNGKAAGLILFHEDSQGRFKVYKRLRPS